MAESQIVEYKESWRDEYLKWICGFTNAQGGVIYIGRKDDGTPCGVEDSKRLLEDIPNKVRDVLGLIVDVDLETMENTTLCIKGRHDPCVVLRARPVVEAAAALTMMDLMQRQNGNL